MGFEFTSAIANAIKWAAGAWLLYLVATAANGIVFGKARMYPGPFWTKFSEWPRAWNGIKGNKTMWIHKLHLEYGPVVRVAPDWLDISDVGAVRTIYRSSPPFLKSEYYKKFLAGPNLPLNLFTFTDPALHRERRTLIGPPLSEAGIRKYDDMISEHVLRGINGMETEAKAEGVTDALKWLLYIASDVMGTLTFSESFHLLDSPKPNQHYHDIHSFGTLNMYRVEIPKITKWLGRLKMDPFWNAMEAVNRIRGYSVNSWETYKAKVAAGENVPPIIFDKFINKHSNGIIPEISIIREGMGFIIAGSDSTAGSTSYLMWAISRDKKLRDTLVEELEHLGRNFAIADVRNLAYLDRLVTEGLRLYTSSPSALPRVVPQGGVTFAGHYIPEGLTVSTQAYTMHRREDVFPDAEKYDPDRWLNPTPEMLTSYIPFGAGSRICIGMYLAKMEMKLSLALFFKRYPNARCVETDADMKPKEFFLICPEGKRVRMDLGLEAKS